MMLLAPSMQLQEPDPTQHRISCDLALALFSANLGPVYREAVKCVFKYVKGAWGLRLTYGRSGNLDP